MSRKTLITIVILFLFVSSIAAVYVAERLTPPKKGTVAVTREEVVYMNIKGKGAVTDSRYVINYAVMAIEDGDLVTLTDVTSRGLKPIQVEQEKSNTSATYDAQTGEVKVQVTKFKANENYKIQVAFEADPVLAYDGDNVPVTRVSPAAASYGYKGLIEVNISPFKIKETANLKAVGLYIWFTKLAPERTIVDSKPEAFSQPPAYEAVWTYTDPASASYGSHAALFNVNVDPDPKAGDVLLRSWVEVRYTTTLLLKGDPAITDSGGSYFPGGGTAYSTQYEYTIGGS